MEECVWQALAICPAEVQEAVAQACAQPKLQPEELRLRAGSPIRLGANGREWALSLSGRMLSADAAMLRQIVQTATGQSLYAAQEKLRQGYCTLPGGHRLGVCGSAVMQNGMLQTLQEFSSLNIRIARQVRGCADAVSRELWQRPVSLLLCGPPGSGKTTLLRDLIRQMSDRYRYRVCVLDERGELAACLDGTPQLDVGGGTDVLTGCDKETGIYLLLRSMRPDWIALDEISAAQDVEAIARASCCGVRFVATAHAWDRADLQNRPLYRTLLSRGVFQTLAFLDRDRRVHCERIGND